MKEFPIEKGVSHIYVDLNNVFTVKIKTHNKPFVKIEAQSEGEYANNFVLQNKIKNESLLISGSVSLGIVYPQDKLSAHKVHVIEVSLLVPENKHIVFTSDLANVKIEGEYNSVFLNLYSGNVTAKDLIANSIIKTVTGDVELALRRGKINCESKYGKIVKEDVPEGSLLYQLKTLKGNINIQTIR
ncbi:hypothetical protein [Pseudofulvibacter geojedonensis]|uniref:Adhesin domain-containing protein n=1 Tax=Pseudofulvibacter geojedonensis TaxID=1123758 RepID=A0ABW3I1N6_9FLAO